MKRSFLPYVRSQGPPFPEAIPDSEPHVRPQAADEATAEWFLLKKRRALKPGCYLLRYMPVSATFDSLHYDGTLRVQREGSSTTASGDLYLHRVSKWSHSGEPHPARGIPIFPRARYRYYVRVTRILEGETTAKTFDLGFELHRFDQATRTWTMEAELAAQMKWTFAPPGYPSGSDYLVGEVENSSGATIGYLTMGWISRYLRRAVVEIDRVPESEAPVTNGNGIDWRTVFDQVGWDLTVSESESNLLEPSGESWSDAEMHAEMLNRRDASNLDAEWRYHVLAVRLLDSTERGIMYDAYGGDSNNIPREGAGISSHWMVPDDPFWGHVRGLRFGAATAPYFRTVVHEIGHAMGLYHNTIDNGFMNTTPTIAGDAVPPVEFPDNVQWSFAADDTKRLRHFPDVWIRPGGIPFGEDYGTSPISPDDAIEDVEGLSLTVSGLLDELPLGAPARINLTLENRSETPLPVPASLSLKRGHISGKVIDGSGNVRTFSTIIRCVEDQSLTMLEPGRKLSDSLTLLRGAEGPLFPAPGLHRIQVEVTWDAEGSRLRAVGEASIVVTPAVDAEHARAAARIFSSPDSLLVLVLGGDHLPEGIEAIRAGVENRILRPHFGFIEARRVGRRFRKRSADLKAAAQLLDAETVMSAAELKRAADFFKNGGKDAAADGSKRVTKLLQEKARTLDVEELVKA